MAERQRDIRPSDGELAILRVLWDGGPATVREVHDTLDRGDVRYTTTLKIMQNMLDKGLLQRQAAGNTHIYRAAVRQAATQKRLVRDLLSKAFDGSAGRLAVAALKTGQLSDNEIKEIRRLLAEKGTDDECDQ